MQFAYSPPSPAPGASQNYDNGLNFMAQSVVVTTGPNFVTILPDNYTLGPGAIGQVYVLSQASQVAQFNVQAPPAGQAPIGPTQQLQTTITYYEEQLPAAAATFTAPQTVAVIDRTMPASVGTDIFVGLARAMTCAAWTQSGGIGSFFAYGIDPNIPASSPILLQQINTVNAAGFAAGQGTTNFEGTSLAFTIHLWPQFNINMSIPYYISVRLYY